VECPVSLCLEGRVMRFGRGTTHTLKGRTPGLVHKPVQINRPYPSLGVEPSPVSGCLPSLGVDPSAASGRTPSLGVDPSAVSGRPPNLGVDPSAVSGRTPSLGVDPSAVSGRTPSLGENPLQEIRASCEPRSQACFHNQAARLTCLRKIGRLWERLPSLEYHLEQGGS